MVVNFGQQFNLLRSGALNDGIIENKHGFTIFTGQPVNEFMNAKGEFEQESSPAEIA